MLIVHVDRGWAWAAAVGGFIANVIIGGLSKSFGMVMKEFEDVFECPSAYMTLAGGLIYTFMYVTSLGVHFASTRFGTRLVMAVGSLGCSACIIGAALAPGVEVWVALIGGGLGFFLSCIYFSSFVVVGRCFDRYLGLANGVSVSGISVGQVAFPNLVSYLIDKYTIRGATLIAGALALHFLVSAVLMPSEIVRPPSQGRSAEASDAEADAESRADGSAAQAVRPSGDAAEQQQQLPPMDWTLFLVFTSAKIFCDVGDVGLSIMYPPFGTENALSNELIGYAIAAGGAVDLVSRLSIGWFSDRKFVRRSFILLAAWLLDAATGIGMSLVSAYPGFVACYGLFGVCSGTAMALMVVVLTDFVGPDHLPRAFAIMMVAMGVVIAPGQFLLGHIKDITYSYRWSIRVASFLLLCGSFCLAIESPIRFFRKQQLRKKYASPLTGDAELTPMAEQLKSFSDEASQDGRPTSTTSLHIIANADVAETLKIH